MDAFDEIEDQIRRQENKVKAQELKKRLAELEKDLVETPAQPRVKHVEVAEPASESRLISKKWSDWGKFCLMVSVVIVSIKLATWIGTVLLLGGMSWAFYKMFLESKK